MTGDLFLTRAADISPCGRYRYRLWRGWDPDKPTLNVIGLNPSTADAVRDDPTTRRCIDFARRWHMGSLVLTNLGAYRATNPRELLGADDWIGPENDYALWTEARRADMVLVAWGAVDRRLAYRAEVVCEGLAAAGINTYCLGVTADGEPRHPLYVEANRDPQGYWRSVRRAAASRAAQPNAGAAWPFPAK